MVRLRDPREAGRRPPTAPSEDGAESEGQFAYSAAALSRLLSTNSDWARVRESERIRLGLQINEHAEFWMPLDDVVSQFTELVVCRLLNRNVFAVSRRRPLYEAARTDRWRSGALGTSADRSGGAGDTLLRNPQYAFDIKNSQDEILVQLLQFHEPSPDSNGFTNFLIGFTIIKVEENRATRLHKQWDHTPTVVQLDHRRRREAGYRGSLCAGRYILLPTTFRPGDAAHYLLRVFAHNGLNLRELTEDLPRPGICSCLTTSAEWVTVVSVHRAEMTATTGKWTSEFSPYCIVTCEGSKEKTSVGKDSYPTWENSFVFYRKNVDKPLKVQVYSRRLLLPDELLGENLLPAVVNHASTPLATGLNPPQPRRRSPAGDGEDSQVPPSGTLYLTILTEDNLMAV